MTPFLFLSFSHLLIYVRYSFLSKHCVPYTLERLLHNGTFSLPEEKPCLTTGAQQ